MCISIPFICVHCIIIMCNIELINKICLYYIYSKEIRRLVITSNNAPVVK